jgi:hypothetical protein
MTRRAWMLILITAVCTTALPGCAPTTHSLLQGNSGAEDRIHAVQPSVPVGNVQSDGTEETEFTGPRQPVGQVAWPASQLDQNSGSNRQAALLPGWRVPEFEGPPPVLQPQDWQAPTLAQQVGLPALGDPVVPQAIVVETRAAPEPDAVMALRSLLQNQSIQAVKCLEKYDPATQELLMRLLPAVALISEKGSIDKLSAVERGALDDQMKGLLLSLHALTDLTIDKMCLCECIASNGTFKPQRQGYAYQPRELVQVFLLLRNLTSAQRDDGYYVTALHGKVSLKDATGEVWSLDFRGREQPLISATACYDCYRPYDFYVPVVPPGHYTLIIEIADETRPGRRLARKSVDFTVAAPVSHQ